MDFAAGGAVARELFPGHLEVGDDREVGILEGLVDLISKQLYISYIHCVVGTVDQPDRRHVSGNYHSLRLPEQILMNDGSHAVM